MQTLPPQLDRMMSFGGRTMLFAGPSGDLTRRKSRRASVDTLSDSGRKGVVIAGNYAAMNASRHVLVAADRRALYVCLVER